MFLQHRRVTPNDALVEDSWRSELSCGTTTTGKFGHDGGAARAYGWGSGDTRLALLEADTDGSGCVSSVMASGGVARLRVGDGPRCPWARAAG